MYPRKHFTSENCSEFCELYSDQNLVNEKYLSSASMSDERDEIKETEGVVYKIR